MSLGWSIPKNVPENQSLPSCVDAPQRPRMICAISPQDDWIYSRCGCVDRGAMCITKNGNTGSLACCPQGCPTFEGVAEGFIAPVPWSGEGPDAQSNRTREVLVVGGIGLLVAGIVGYAIWRQS